jgi:signal transduction histidine kinase
MFHRLRQASIFLLLGAAYVVAGKFGLMLAILNPSVSPVWPPTGIAAAGLLLFGFRFWPAVFAGAFLVNFTTTGFIATSFGIAGGNTLEALLMFTLLGRFAGGAKAFWEVNGVLRFVLSAAVATAVCATVGVTMLSAGGLMTEPGVARTWFTWWLGDMVGALTITPLFVLLCSASPWRVFRRPGEAMLLIFLLIAISGSVFGELLFHGSKHYPLGYLSLLPLIWSALRFGPRMTCAVVVALSGFALFATIGGTGPFADLPPDESLMLVQSFIGIVAITGLILAAALHERRLSEQSLEEKVRQRTIELEHARDEDRANLQRLQATILHLPMAALLMDEKGNVLELNEAYCEVFSINLSPEEAKRDPYGELLSRFKQAVAEPEAHMEKVQKAMAEKKPLFNQEIHLKDGRIILRDFIPIHDQGNHRGQLFIYRDVTRERRADKAKSEFMSLASHQLRTPLTAMRWSMSRLQKNLEGKIDPQDQRLLAEGYRAGARMSETIDTMLKIARIESKHDVLRITEFDVCELLNEKQEFFRREYEEKRQSFTIECPGPLPVRTDINFLKEILRNLLQNAIKYTPEGGKIFLRARKTPDALVIEVEDTGYGIPRHQQEHVFQKFFRGDNIVNRDTSGTGLGLYLVSLVTETLGGSIRVRSEENKGTLFTVSLPLREPR